MKTVIQIVLTIAVIALGYLCYDSINQPIRFQEQQKMRADAVVQRLIDIREAQVAYKSVYNKYTGSFDTLIAFIKSDSLPLVKMEGRLTDSMLEAGITEIKALAMGIIKRDTIRISVKDSIFRSNYSLDSMAYVPFLNGTKKFELATATVETASGVKVLVFEAKVANNVYLDGLDKQEIININDVTKKIDENRYCGLKVGSLTEANNNAGNWE